MLCKVMFILTLWTGRGVLCELELYQASQVLQPDLCHLPQLQLDGQALVWLDVSWPAEPMSTGKGGSRWPAASYLA